MAPMHHFGARRQLRGRHGQQLSAEVSGRERIVPDPLTWNVLVSVGIALTPGPAGCVGIWFQGCRVRLPAMAAATFIDIGSIRKT